MMATRVVVDVLLAVDLIFVMATALVEEAPHEYLGILLIVLAVAHTVLNRRWFTVLNKGRWSALRVLQALVMAALIACAVGQVASAVVLSKHALWFLPAISGAAWARSVHMICSYWMFVLAFAHAGLQLRSLLARTGVLRNAKPAALWVARAIWAAIAIAGVVSFVQLGFPDYLLARVQFAAADYATPVPLLAAQYATVAVMIAGLFHYIRVLFGSGAKPSSA